MLAQDNVVIIRLWTSNWNFAHKGESVGHVSIEIPKLHQPGQVGSGYFSLWPRQEGVDPAMCLPANPAGHGLCSPRAGMLLTGYKRPGQVLPHDALRSVDGYYDLDFEGRVPEITICLYGLNVASINTEFEATKTRLEGWNLLGNNCLLNQGTGHSCSSYAYTLLKAGGIYNLISSAHSSKFSSVVTPDGLSQALIRAKREETRLYPVTRNWVYADESDIAREKTCAIL